MGIATIEGLEFERYVQSAFRIATNDRTVYVDPHRLPAGAPKADLVLVTHEHFDHFDPEAIETVRKDDTVIIANAPCATKLAGRGIVISVREGDEVLEQGIQVRAVAGYNAYHPRGANVGFVFALGNVRILHTGDSDNVSEWGTLGDIDIALLPIGGTYTMDETAAADAVHVLLPRIAIPMHYGYATGGDPQKFRDKVGSASRVEIL